MLAKIKAHNRSDIIAKNPHFTNFFIKCESQNLPLRRPAEAGVDKRLTAAIAEELAIYAEENTATKIDLVTAKTEAKEDVNQLEKKIDSAVAQLDRKIEVTVAQQDKKIESLATDNKTMKALMIGLYAPLPPFILPGNSRPPASP